MKNVKSICVSFLAPMENHMANGGEKLLGNASSIKKRPDGRVYISGQMQRHALFSAIDRFNLEDEDRGDTYVSNGDGITSRIETDLRADLGGFMHPSQGNYSGRRIAPVSATFATAMEPSEISRDLLLRLKQDPDEKADQNQALATAEFSQSDEMHMNFHLDVSALSVSKRFKYEEQDDKTGMHVGTEYVRHADSAERLRRAKLFVKATRFLSDYAMQARAATTGEPQKAFIVLDTVHSRKASRFYQMDDSEQKTFLSELDDRGAKVFIGDDTLTDGLAVFEAYRNALESIESLYDPTGGAEPVPFRSYAEEADG